MVRHFVNSSKLGRSRIRNFRPIRVEVYRLFIPNLGIPCYGKDRIQYILFDQGASQKNMWLIRWQIFPSLWLLQLAQPISLQRYLQKQKSSVTRLRKQFWIYEIHQQNIRYWDLLFAIFLLFVRDH